MAFSVKLQKGNNVMAIIRRRPMWPEMGDEIERFFEDFPSFDLSRLPEVKGFTPAVDIYEKGDKIIVETPLAGVSPEDVEISIEKDTLTIKGKSERKREVDEKDYYRKEVRYGSFYRSIPLPTGVKGEDAVATSEGGMLKIEMPKAEEEKKKMIKIEVKK